MRIRALPALCFVFLMLFFMAGAVSLSYGGVSVALKLDRHSVSVADTITMKVIVRGSNSAEAPVLRNMDGFTVSSTGRTSSFKMINGSVESSIEYNFLLVPSRPGKFVLGPAVVNVDGKQYVSNSETVLVKKNMPRSGTMNKDVFLDASVSSEDVVVEQPFVYTLKLYHRVEIRNLSLTLPESQSFDIKKAGDPVEYDSRQGDYMYHVIELKYIITPFEHGVLEIRPAIMRMEKIKRQRGMPNSMFSDPFFGFGQAVPYSAVSNAVSVNVSSPPVKGRPKDYTGLVGEYDMDVTLAPDHITAGESATLTITIKGTGNVQRIPTIKLRDIPGCRIYPDAPVFESSVTEQGIQGTKTMKWALVPVKAGHYRIPATGFSYYSPSKKRYESLVSDPLVLNVEPGKAVNSKTSSPSGSGKTAASPGRKQAVTELGRDILTVHTDPASIFRAGQWMLPGWALVVMFVIPPAVFLLVTVLKERGKRGGERLAAKKAASILYRQCDTTVSPSDLLTVIRDYINNRFGYSYGSVTAADVEMVLKGAGAGDTLSKEFSDLVSLLERAVYAGDRDTSVSSDMVARMVREIEERVA